MVPAPSLSHRFDTSKEELKIFFLSEMVKNKVVFVDTLREEDDNVEKFSGILGSGLVGFRGKG